MARILITSGPTRQYLDPVRYLTNASSGQMGAALAEAAVVAGHDVVVVSGPVHLQYPSTVEVLDVVTTDEMFEMCHQVFKSCDGVIGAAAPCDYKMETVSPEKLAKTGNGLLLKLVETPDVIASLGRQKQHGQWAVGFALETHDANFRAITKMQKKSCDLMVVNGPAAIDSTHNQIKILDRSGEIIREVDGPKTTIAELIISEIDQRLIK